MINQNQLQEYYNLRSKKFYDPKFEALTENEIRRLETSIGFKFWKLIKSRQQVSHNIKRSLQVK
jgi:hypothetical protein